MCNYNILGGGGQHSLINEKHGYIYEVRDTNAKPAWVILCIIKKKQDI